MEEEMPGVFPGDEAMPESTGRPVEKIDKRLVVGIIIVLGILGAALLFSAPLILMLNKFGMIEIPWLGGQDQMQMLIIGQPSVDLLADLDNQQSIVYYRVKDAADLGTSQSEKLAQYDVVLLDQHLGATSYEKSVSRALGEAIENYVLTGGKLIVVMDSGIYRSGGEYGTGVASDVIGWEETFGDIIPVECDDAQNGMPTCQQPIFTTGRIYRLDFDSKIMEGIEVAPANEMYDPLSILTFNVKPTGQQIAYIKHIATASNYPAIVEKKLLIGKSIYFNYDPAMTPGIWQNTLEYLR